jgi:NADPH:quinone reductase-like Zn-dependent oxidoreductase
VIDSEGEDIVKRVVDITNGKLAYGAIDAVAGELTKVVGQCVRQNGSILVYGALSGAEGSFNVKDIIFRYLFLSQTLSRASCCLGKRALLIKNKHISSLVECMFHPIMKTHPVSLLANYLTEQKVFPKIYFFDCVFYNHVNI